MPCVLLPFWHASPSITLPKEPLLDLRVDAMKPLLRAVGSFLGSSRAAAASRSARLRPHSTQVFPFPGSNARD